MWVDNVRNGMGYRVIQPTCRDTWPPFLGVDWVSDDLNGSPISNMRVDSRESIAVVGGVRAVHPLPPRMPQ